MAKTDVQPGTRITYTNSTGSLIPVDSVVFVGDLPGIAQTDIADGESGELAVCGVHRLKKNNALVVTMGDRLYWDTTNKEVTKTVTHKLLGIAWKSELSTATLVDVKLGDTAFVAAASTFDKMANIPVLVDNGGGATADGTIGAITGDASVSAAVKELSTKLNAVINSLVSNGFMAAP